MYLFLEGPDRCGKTNITAALSSHYDVPSFKVPTEKKNWLAGTFQDSIPFDILLPEFVYQTNTSFISDRCYISEIVYSKVYSRETDLESLWKIDVEWARMNAVIIIPLRRDYSSFDDELVEQEKIQQVHNEYERFIEQTACNTIKIYVDEFDNDLKRQIPRLVEQINLCQSNPDWRGKVTIGK